MISPLERFSENNHGALLRVWKLESERLTVGKCNNHPEPEKDGGNRNTKVTGTIGRKNQYNTTHS